MGSDANQPPDSLRAPPHAVHDIYSRGREPYPPLLTGLLYVHPMGGTKLPPPSDGPLRTGYR